MSLTDAHPALVAYWMLCPWQTERELQAQLRFLRSLEASLVSRGWRLDERDALFGLNQPDRVWRAKGES